MTLIIDKNVYGSLLAEFQPKIITSEEENDKYLEVVERLMAYSERSPEQDALLDLLVIIIEKFESEHYQLHGSTPQSILQHLMDARDIKQEDLVGVIGSRGVVSEVINGKRSISKAQAKALAELFSVDVGLFI